jgi:hypothetical protein
MLLREMQMFLAGYLLISICEIFTVGGIPLDDDVRKVSGSPVEDFCQDINLTRASRQFISASS